jgi:hypothetical protein
MSFFQSEGKINIAQSDVRISAENGLSFKQDQVVGIYIPPSIKYFSGKDCYLQFDAVITNDTSAGDVFPTRLQLDAEIGAHALFSSLRVYAGNRETLLEENTEYPSYVSLKYNYNKNDVIQNKRAMDEGCGCWVPATKGSNGTSKSIANNYVYSPWMEGVNTGSADEPNAEILSAPNFINAKITLPIHCGVFSECEKVYPNLLTNGLYLELVMANGRNLFRQMDGVLMDRRPTLNPRVYGVSNAGGNWTNGDAEAEIWCQYDNSMKTSSLSPFIVGEKIGFVKGDNTIVTITENGATDTAVITSITTADDRLKITLTGAGPTQTSGGALNFGTTEIYLFSNSLRGSATASSFSPSVEIKNVELIVHQISMSPEYERSMLSKVSQGGVVKFDFNSVGVQRHSTLSSETQPSVPLHLDYSRARGIICVPTDATLYPTQHQTCAKGTYLITKDNHDKFREDTLIRSNRTGLEGCSNGLSEYSFFLNGKMVPSRAIKTNKASNKKGGIDANYLVELEKSLVSFGIEPTSFEYYNRNFVIGRMLAIGSNAVFDGRGRSARLDLKYEGSTADEDAPSVNLLWKIFISHIRTLEIKSNNIDVLM